MTDRRPSRGPLASWRVLGIEMRVGEPLERAQQLACAAIGVDPSRLRGFRIARRALDARRRDGVHRLRFVVHADVWLEASERPRGLNQALRSGRAAPSPGRAEPRVERVHPSLEAPRRAHVAVVGAGPAGLFATLVLARHGLRVTLLERGSPIERRGRELVAFHRTRVPNPESNLLFGEGGAGTYSDGKLYTRVDDELEIALLEELVACGAQPEIVWDARAHIGTDRLHAVLPRLRAKLVEAGVEIAWNARVERLVIDDAPLRRVRALATSKGEIECDAVVMAPGHSARDLWATLHAQGVAFEAKPFQLGLRIEHPQELVDRAQHGVGYEADLLGAASYALVARASEHTASAHSFCMCPGGRIVASVNEPGFLCTNGMSNSGHSSPWANAAIVATFGERECGPGVFAGLEVQRALEARFFAEGGSDYTAPSQRASDFLAGRASSGKLATSYVLGARPARLDEIVPPFLRDALCAALARFERSIPGFAGDAGLFVGVETRSACPVRMTRDATRRSASGFSNLFPSGEGAGFAGGIMSAALDGARTALALLEHGT